MKSFIVLYSLISICSGVQFKISNNHRGPIWVGIQGNSGHPALERGGFVLNERQSRVTNAPSNWAGRFWARTWCDNNSKHCQTGDCGNKIQCNGAGGVPPATLVEILLKGHKGQDFYDISLVDGFNSMAAIRPINGRGPCPTLSCKRDLNRNCPRKLRVYLNGQSNQQTIGCKSACLLTNQPQHCCTGQFGTEATCKPDTWASDINSARYFKANCPQAYSYAYDDRTSLYTCFAERYDIEFG